MRYRAEKTTHRQTAVSIVSSHSRHSFIHSYSFNKKFDMSQTLTIKDTPNINTIVDERTIVNERYRLKGIGLIGIFVK